LADELNDMYRPMGVARTTIEGWLDKKNMRNDGPVKAHKPSPDSRVKINPDVTPKIVERIDEGETQAQIAADLDVDQATISRIVKAERKKAEIQAEREKVAPVRLLGVDYSKAAAGPPPRLRKIPHPRGPKSPKMRNIPHPPPPAPREGRQDSA
jgi:predicted XRE-type DNA-binding protein